MALQSEDVPPEAAASQVAEHQPVAADLPCAEHPALEEHLEDESQQQVAEVRRKEERQLFEEPR